MDSKTDDDGARKKTSGRRRIEIKKISNVNSRQVTFSKRRMGLFRKASELCILTGTEVAIIVHSSGNHVYSFGHPDVKSVINRYLHRHHHLQGGGRPASASPPSSDSNDHLMKKAHYEVVQRELEAERKKAKNNKIKQEENCLWWNEDIENLGVEELERYLTALEDLKKKVSIKADQLKEAAADSWCLGPVAEDGKEGMIASSSYLANYGSDNRQNDQLLNLIMHEIK